MIKVGILFPHQLFEQNSLAIRCNTIYLVEEVLFFNQYKFHKQKIAFHRATMKFYESYLQSKNVNVIYIDSFHELADIRKLIPHLKSIHITEFEYIDVSDYLLERRISRACRMHQVQSNKKRSPLFLNTVKEVETYFSSKKKMFQTDFYKNQRQTRNILIDKEQKTYGREMDVRRRKSIKISKGKNTACC